MGIATIGTSVLETSDRDRVLRAMAECCAERGYAETRVEEVIARAGVGRERFATLFGGKEDCAVAAINRLVSEALARVSIAGAGAPGASVEQRRAEARAIVELLAAMPAFARLVLVDARQGATPRMRAAHRSALGILALMLARACGREDGEAERSARAALGGVEALVRRELVAGRAEDLPALTGDLIYAALAPFVGPREALRQARLAAGS